VKHTISQRRVRMGTRISILWLVLTAAFAATGRLQAQEPTRPPVEDQMDTAPVEIDGAVLFRVRGLSSLPADRRAGAITDRIVAAASDPAVSVDSLRVADTGTGAEITAGDRPLMMVVDADAALEQVGRVELARAHLAQVRQAIVEYRAARAPAALERAAIITAVATALLAIGIVVIVWLWRRVDAGLTRRLEGHVHSVGIQSFEVMRADRVRSVIQNAMGGIQTLLLLAGVLVYLGYVLAAWPWTRGLSRSIVAFAIAPLRVMVHGLVANIPSLTFLIVLFFVVRLMLRLIRLFFEGVERGTVTLTNFDADWAAPTYKIVRVAIVSFGLIVAYPYIPGSESEAFKGVSLFIGIVFSLGSSSAISNVIAGYMMTYRRAFRVGDRVKIGDAVGDVIQMRLQVTHLRSFKNEEIVIPNSQILAGEVVNYSSFAKAQGLILHTEVGIGYETPWRQVEALLLTAAARCGSPSAEAPRAFIVLKKLGDFAVTYELNLHCADATAMLPMYTTMHRNILDVFNEYGVQIMTPAYEGDPAEPKVVPAQDWFRAPAAPTSGGAPVAGTPALVAVPSGGARLGDEVRDGSRAPQ
jgi:small-conductance mechanosensitive channel